MSETKVIHTIDELLSLRDSAGVIKHYGHMHIECDVPYSAGKHISDLYVECNLIADGDLYVHGDLSVLDNLTVQGNLIVHGDLYVDGNMCVLGNLYVHGDMTVLDNLTVQGAIYHDPSQRWRIET